VYNSILNEPWYLSRTLKCIRAATGLGIVSNEQFIDFFQELETTLPTVEDDVKKASEGVKSTIEMVKRNQSAQLIHRSTITCL
jgi:hypothetical protein